MQNTPAPVALLYRKAPGTRFWLVLQRSDVHNVLLLSLRSDGNIDIIYLNKIAVIDSG